MFLSQRKIVTYALYWSGNSVAENCLSGVGLMIRYSINFKLENMLTAYSNRMISMRLPVSNLQYAAQISVQSPTLNANPMEKGKFTQNCAAY